MLNIAICDDDLFFAQQALNEVKKVLLNHHVMHHISVFQTGASLIAAGYFDMVFLDIEMTGMSGIETAEKLRQQRNKCRIIFLTSYKKYVFSAFDVSASHYLLKPIDTLKLEAVLTKIASELTAEKEHCCTVKYGTQIYRVPFSHIKYVEIFGRKITLYSTQDVFTFNGRLDELEQTFPSHFFRCHKSYLVNLAMVMKYDKETAVLQSGEQVPIARRKFSEFGTAFLAFLQEEGDV